MTRPHRDAWLEQDEKAWQREVIKLARTFGWDHVYHVHDSRRSAHGFPDLVLVRERVVFVELKSERGKPTVDQIGWLDALERAGAECYLLRPSDVEQLARILSSRGPMRGAA